ncbi:MAG: LysR family transcriptional regulator [Actinobacteria bacterium]|nr:LysR family transcriptional regulator [Actinomycetota bacterium]
MRLPASSPELSALDFFVSVVDQGSLSRAASQHYISQPSASVRIRRLEQRVGVQLLDRSPSGSLPTEAGLELVKYARDVLSAAGAFNRAAEDLATSRDHRPLRIIASYTMSDYIFPRWLRAIGSDIPNVSMAARNAADTISGIVAGEAEVGFTWVRKLHEPVQAVPVGQDELVVVVRPDHHWNRRLRPLRPEHLAAAELVLREQHSGTRSQLDRLLEPHRPDPPPRPVLVLGSTGAAKAAVLDGVAPAVLSRLTVMEELESGRLISIPVDDLDFGRTLFAIWQDHTELSVEAEQLLQFVTSERARRMIKGMRPQDPTRDAAGQSKKIRSSSVLSR